jgi:hypothetical protein
MSPMLIATTILERDFVLWPPNRKDFHYMDDINLVRFNRCNQASQKRG